MAEGNGEKRKRSLSNKLQSQESKNAYKAIELRKERSVFLFSRGIEKIKKFERRVRDEVKFRETV